MSGLPAPKPEESGRMTRVGETPAGLEIDRCDVMWPFCPNEPWIALAPTREIPRVTRGSVVYPSYPPVDHKYYTGEQPRVIAPGTHAERADVAQPIWNEGVDYMPLAKLLQNHGKSLGFSAVLEGSEVTLYKNGKPIVFNEGCDALIDAHLISQLPESLRLTGCRTNLLKPELQNNLFTKVSFVGSLGDVLTTLKTIASESGAPEYYDFWESQVLQSPNFCSFRIDEFSAGISVYQKDTGYMIRLNDPSNSLVLPNSHTSDTCVDYVTCSLNIPHNENKYAVIDLTQTGLDSLLVARHAAGEYNREFSDRCTILGNNGMYQVHINFQPESTTVLGGSTLQWRLLDNRIIASQLPEHPLSLVVTVSTTDSEVVTNPDQIKEMRDLCWSIGQKLFKHHEAAPELREESF